MHLVRGEYIYIEKVAKTHYTRYTNTTKLSDNKYIFPKKYVPLQPK